jgi:hypothetical protein
MRDVDRIIEEYRKSDFGKRVYLFLEHRSLRNEFVDIDMEEPQNESQTKPIWVVKPIRSTIGRLISALKHGWST